MPESSEGSDLSDSNLAALNLLVLEWLKARRKGSITINFSGNGLIGSFTHSHTQTPEEILSAIMPRLAALAELRAMFSRLLSLYLN
jgi:hypothetical protein